jgi:hypothetical protein
MVGGGGADAPHLPLRRASSGIFVRGSAITESSGVTIVKAARVAKAVIVFVEASTIVEAATVVEATVLTIGSRSGLLAPDFGVTHLSAVAALDSRIWRLMSVTSHRYNISDS